MNTWFKKNVALLCLLAVGIATACGIMVQRHSIEEQNKSYDIVVDYAEYSTMAYQSECSISEWMQYLADYGVTKVALFETNVEALAGNPTTDVYRHFVKDLMYDPHWDNSLPAEMVEWVKASTSNRDVIVTSSDPEVFDWILNAYERRTDGMIYEVYRDGDVGYLCIRSGGNGLDGEEWTKVSLGLWPDQVRSIEDAGMQVIPRTKTVSGANGEKFASAVFEDFAAYESPYFMNSGDALIGYDDPDWAKHLNDYLEETNSAFIVTEMMTEISNIQWAESPVFVESTDYNAIRAFHMWEFVSNRYQSYGYDGPQEIVNSLYRAIYERNCRLINLLPILPQGMTGEDAEEGLEYITDPAAYEGMITGLIDRMDQYGFEHQTIAPAEYYRPAGICYFLLALAAVAAAVMVLELFVPLGKKFRWILYGLGVVCAFGAIVAAPNTSKILLSLAGGIMMPCLAAVGLNRYLSGTRDRWYGEDGSFKGTLFGMLKHIVPATVVLMVVSFGGALLVSAPLSESAFFLEMNMYRGVKFMQLIPLMVFAVSYLQIFLLEQYIFKPLPADIAKGRDRVMARKGQWHDFLETPVKLRGVWYAIVALIVLAVLAVLGMYYITRTGNTEAGTVSALEMQFRNALEGLFVARPRMKEYLVGYPCMMLMIWAVYRKLPGIPLVFGAGAVIGYTSIVNTFLHIRTMIEVSFSRVLVGFGMGLVIGILVVIVAELLYRLIKGLYRQYLC